MLMVMNCDILLLHLEHDLGYSPSSSIRTLFLLTTYDHVVTETRDSQNNAELYDHDDLFDCWIDGTVPSGV